MASILRIEPATILARRYLETHDERRILPFTCFSIEPGIYLPEFGIRSEVNMITSRDNAVVTGRIQRELVRI
jgi:Xaa-Pro dipeptidase